MTKKKGWGKKGGGGRTIAPQQPPPPSSKKVDALPAQTCDGAGELVREVVVSEDEEYEELPTEFTPISFAVMSEAHRMRQQNGLRHEDYQRYRRFCTRRLQRVRDSLKFKQGRGRYRKKTYPKRAKDRRFLLALLLAAERCWTHAMELKAKNSRLVQSSRAIERHSRKRIRKAACHAADLLLMTQSCCDRRTALEAQGYYLWLCALSHVERKEWRSAVEKCVKFSAVYRLLRRLTAAGSEGEIAYSVQLEECQTLLRICRYQLARDGLELQDVIREAVTSTTTKSGGSSSKSAWSGRSGVSVQNMITGKDATKNVVNWRGQTVSLPTSVSNVVQSLEASGRELRFNPCAALDANQKLHFAMPQSDEIQSNYDKLQSEGLRSLEVVQEALLADVFAEDKGNAAAVETKSDAMLLAAAGSRTSSDVWSSLPWAAAEGHVKDLVIVAEAEKNACLLWQYLWHNTKDAQMKDEVEKQATSATKRVCRARRRADVPSRFRGVEAADNFHKAAHSLEQHFMVDGSTDGEPDEFVTPTSHPPWWKAATNANVRLIQSIELLKQKCMDCRAVCNSVEFAAAEKYAEAFVILQFIESRMNRRRSISAAAKLSIIDPLMNPLGSVELIFGEVDRHMTECVGPLKRSMLVKASTKALAQKRLEPSVRDYPEKEQEKSEAAPYGEIPRVLSVALDSLEFPPKAFAMAHKPVLYDLAYSHYESPAGRWQTTEKSSESTGLMGKISSWWGRP